MVREHLKRHGVIEGSREGNDENVLNDQGLPTNVNFPMLVGSPRGKFVFGKHKVPGTDRAVDMIFAKQDVVPPREISLAGYNSSSKDRNANEMMSPLDGNTNGVSKGSKTKSSRGGLSKSNNLQHSNNTVFDDEDQDQGILILTGALGQA